MATTKVTHDLFYPGLSSDGFLSTDANAPQIERLYGRRFRGVGADHGAQADGSVTGGSWLQSFPNPLGGNVTAWDYFEDQSWDASVSNSKIARSSASRTAGGEIAIGLAGVALNDGAGFSAWGGYFDAVRANGSAGVTHGVEINAANADEALTAPTPFQNTTDFVSGLSLRAGSDSTIWGNSYAISDYLNVGDNGAIAHQVILVRANSVLRDGMTDEPGATQNDGYGRFASLPNNIGVSWWSNNPRTTPGTQEEVVKLTSVVDDPDVKWLTRWTDTAFEILDDVAPESAHFSVSFLSNAAAGIGVTPAVLGGAPTIGAIGFNPNINLVLAPKGSGTVIIPIGNVPEHADSAAAAAAGLPLGTVFRTGDTIKIRAT